MCFSLCQRGDKSSASICYGSHSWLSRFYGLKQLKGLIIYVVEDGFAMLLDSLIFL
jgi:hypothetical protein